MSVLTYVFVSQVLLIVCTSITHLFPEETFRLIQKFCKYDHNNIDRQFKVW